MNKLIALVALGLIVGGFLLVTFSYASPTSPTGTNGLPDISDITHGTGRPDPPNDYVPSTPPVEETPPPPDTTPPPETTPPPDTTPPPAEETYVTKYFWNNFLLKAIKQPSGLYEAQASITVTYPTNHPHSTYFSADIQGSTHFQTSQNIYMYGDGPITIPLQAVSGSNVANESCRYWLSLCGMTEAQAVLTLYVTEWPSSKLSIFGTQTTDMTIGVVMLIAGFAALLMFRRH